MGFEFAGLSAFMQGVKVPYFATAFYVRFGNAIENRSLDLINITNDSMTLPKILNVKILVTEFRTYNTIQKNLFNHGKNLLYYIVT